MSDEREVTKETSTSSSLSEQYTASPDRDTSKKKSDNSLVKLAVREDGILDIEFEIRKQLNLSKKIGEFGGIFLCIGLLVTVITPILYVSGFITSPALALAILGAPFALGTGFVAISNNFELLPFTE